MERPTPDELVATIEMLRTNHPADAFLVVEGDDDCRFWSRRVARDDDDAVMVAGGRAGVEQVAELAFGGPRPIGGVAGIVDRDCAFDGTPPLFATDGRDVEATLILRTTALRAVLAEYASTTAVKNLGGADAVCARLVALTEAHGRARCVAMEGGAAVNFKRGDLHVKRWIDASSWTRVPGFVDRLLALHPELEPARGALLAPHFPGTEHLTCHGKDLIEALHVGLTGRLRGESKPPSEHQIGALLRQSARSADVEAWTLMRDLRAWQATQAPFVWFAPLAV